MGARRIQLELIRNEQIQLSLASIHKALHKIDAKLLMRPKKRKQVKRYEMAIAGQRIQMDVAKTRAGIYQYTAIDDCARYRVLALCRRKTAKNTLDFIDRAVEETPFPINGKVGKSQQTDLQEFYATVDLENISFEELDKELGYW